MGRVEVGEEPVSGHRVMSGMDIMFRRKGMRRVAKAC